MTTTNPHVQASNNSASSFEGIVDAFNVLRTSNGEQTTNYPSSYQGIIRAILDLKKWGQAGGGTNPPGWVPSYDEDGNLVGGGYNPQPQNGSLWFDTRQGRLFIWEDDGWYQTNGGDGLPAAQDNPPDTEVLGSLWYNTTNNSLYIWDGLSWRLIATNEGAAVNTASLPLANPTEEDPARKSFTRLPNTGGLSNQSDLNEWIVDSLEELETAVIEGEHRPVNTSTTPPADSREGDLWFDSDRLELMIKYENYWVSSALPLTDNTDFNILSTVVASNATSNRTKIEGVENRITVLENKPAHTVTLSANTSGLVLTDSQGKNSSVTLAGASGIEVIKSGGTGFIIDAQNLKTSLEECIVTSNNTALVNDLKYRTTGLEAEVAQLKQGNSVDLNALMNNTSLNKIIKEALETASNFDEFKVAALTSIGYV